MSESVKIIVAEDNSVVRGGLVNFLNKWGYGVLEAESGDEALQLIKENSDLKMAILDWNLPGMSGMEICKYVRKNEINGYIYILIFSGRNSTKEQIIALIEGADDYLVKPSKPMLLRARLEVGKRIIALLSK